MTPTREQILAASAGWVAVVLNVLPGLGTGYLYQRRWRAYWITSALASAWFAAQGCAFQLVATKADKLSRSERQRAADFLVVERRTGHVGRSCRSRDTDTCANRRNPRNSAAR